MDTDKIGWALLQTGASVYPGEPMSRHTSFRTGGKAGILCVCRNAASARDAYLYLLRGGVPFKVTGRLTNILVSDKGYDGVILQYAGDTDISAGGDTVFAAGGASAAAIARFAYARSLAGAEFLSTLPGGAGGAVVMNAGCFGGEMKDVTAAVEGLDENGEPFRLAGGECGFAYRHSNFLGKRVIILGAELRLRQGDREKIRSVTDQNRAARKKQPGEPGAGSVFRRQEGILPAKLIDEAGLKGMREGGAAVSPKHAGFIVNTGGAASAEVFRLVRRVKDIIRKEYGVFLREEIELLGDFGEEE
jgi:UDP-N-acetylmuramate dehydrogenase